MFTYLQGAMYLMDVAVQHRANDTLGNNLGLQGVGFDALAKTRPVPISIPTTRTRNFNVRERTPGETCSMPLFRNTNTTGRRGRYKTTS